MKVLPRSLVILLVLIALATSAGISGQQITNSPTALNAEMGLHLEQATAYIDQVEMDLIAKNKVNVEALHAVLVELTLAQRVINSADSQERATLGYQFSDTTLDITNSLNRLSNQSENQDYLMLKAFVSATTYIRQEVIQESHIF